MIVVVSPAGFDLGERNIYSPTQPMSFLIDDWSQSLFRKQLMLLQDGPTVFPEGSWISVRKSIGMIFRDEFDHFDENSFTINQSISYTSSDI